MFFFELHFGKEVIVTLAFQSMPSWGRINQKVTKIVLGSKHPSMEMLKPMCSKFSSPGDDPLDKLHHGSHLRCSHLVPPGGLRLQLWPQLKPFAPSHQPFLAAHTFMSTLGVQLKPFSLWEGKFVSLMHYGNHCALSGKLVPSESYSPFSWSLFSFPRPWIKGHLRDTMYYCLTKVSHSSSTAGITWRVITKRMKFGHYLHHTRIDSGGPKTLQCKS